MRAESVDAALVKAARDGDAGAFAELYERHRDAVFRYCLARTNADHDAEDLMSEVFVRAMEALPRRDARGVPFLAHLYRIARNARIDRARRYQASSHRLDRETSRSLQRRGLLTALSRLKAEHREVLLLCFVEGYAAADAARLLGRTETAVRNLRLRGLERLRRELSKADASEVFGEATA